MQTIKQQTFYGRRVSGEEISLIQEVDGIVKFLDSGDIMRRCNGTDVPREVQSLFNGVNEILDKIQFQPVSTPHFRG